MTIRSKQLWYVLIIFFSTFAVIGVLLLFNNSVFSIRKLEMDVLLKQRKEEAFRIDYLSMLVHCNLYKKLYTNQITEADLDAEEAKTAELFTEWAAESTVFPDKSPAVLAVINFFRTILHRPLLDVAFETQHDRLLRAAFDLERKKNYKQALIAYAAIPVRKSAPADPGILLHRGFCMSVLGEWQEAKELFRFVLINYKNKEAALAAADLLKNLNDLEKEADVIKQSRASVREKAERLYRLGAFTEALKLLDEAKTPAAIYLKARLCEETGESAKSAALYKALIKDNQETALAKLASHRLTHMTIPATGN